MRRYLMVSPAFPPMSNVGAKRALHFARNTPAMGWDPAVLCLPRAINRDPELEPLVPPVPVLEALRQGPLAWLQDRLHRSETRRHYGKQARADATPGNVAAARELSRRVLRFFESPFDRYAPHVPAALPGALSFMRKHECELVYANAGPFSAVLTAISLSTLGKLPLVLDFRDPWSIEPNYRAGWGRWQTAAIERTECFAFERASAVVLNTETALTAYRETYRGRIEPERFTCIRNHFDPVLYEGAPPSRRPGGPFRIVYYGHLRPTKNGALFLEALAKTIEALSLGPEDLRFEMFGESTDIERRAITRYGLSAFVHRQDWVPFFRSRHALGDADLLLDIMGSHHHLQISGKLYDYMAIGRPILSISTNPEIGRILAESQMGVQVELDASKISDHLCAAYRNRNTWTPPAPERLAPFQAREAARKLTALFDLATRTRKY